MALIGLPVLGIIFILLPGQRANPAALRDDYIHSLRGYEGVRYIWGGENRLGIDCSGLVRAGLINSTGKQAVQSLNPSLLRYAAGLWWQDCSAMALSEEYRQRTKKLFKAPSINAIEASQLQPGDLAVTDDGLHVMAFLGGSEWVEADPDIKRVLIITAPSTNIWFDTPVILMRWRILTESP